MSTRSRYIKIIQIGNSRGIRLPRVILQKYGLSDSVLVEEQEEGLFLRRDKGQKLTWAETFKAMALEKEDWSDFDGTSDDGLDDEDVSTETI